MPRSALMADAWRAILARSSMGHKGANMFGAVIGDIAGSRFEFDHDHKDKAFEFWHAACRFTDDTVCTAAVADILMNRLEPAPALQAWCRDYPGRGYGGRFSEWVWDDPHRAYNSYGNGAAMRVSPAAFLNRADLDAALRAARRVTEITHNHPEGIKGALATTHAVWLALNGDDADTVRQVIAREYGYDLSMSVDEIRPGYVFNETCQETVPQALTCALESRDVEDAIRCAISIGGDSDTVAAIAGTLAEALHGLPAKFMQTACAEYLDQRISDVLLRMYERG